MRRVIYAYLVDAAGRLWLVEFDNGSRIAVNISGAVKAEEKTVERIKLAATKYSNSHPEGVISSVVVDLDGKQINTRLDLTDEDRTLLKRFGISVD